MEDSYCFIWHGPRGGGKTASLVGTCVEDMICYNQRVISNVPISFDYEPEPGGPSIHYESEPLNIDALLALDDSVNNAIIAWDEIPLWAYSRGAQSVLNKLVGLIITLLRKNDLSLYVTTQFLSLIDKNIRIQGDAQIECTDLYYKYRDTMRKGELISQKIVDASGKLSGTIGTPMERLFRAKSIWHTYPTKLKFDVLAAQGTKYKLNAATKLITFGGVEGRDQEAEIEQTVDLLGKLEGNRFDSEGLQAYLQENGIEGSPSVLGKLIRSAGFTKKRTTAGYIYVRG